ncbi:general secretion pathway protein GspH [Xanthomonas campestris]|nr:general secretion pathway protein GspH [Xanthomonas campestris]
MSSPRSQLGWTLAESLVTVALLAVITATAWPSLADLHRTHQVRAVMFELATHLATARSRSISHGNPVAMCPSSTANTCTTGRDWTAGWLIYSDPDGNRTPDTSEDVIASAAPASTAGLSVRTTAGRTQVRYGRLGSSLGTNVTFNICHGDQLGGQVIINMAGRVRSQRPATPQQCPL